MSNIRPCGDRVLVRPMAPEEVSAGGIVIPGSATEKATVGTVVAVGPGSRTEGGEICAVAVVAGDKVLYGKYSGTEYQWQGEDYVFMRESDIMGVVVE